MNPGEFANEIRLGCKRLSYLELDKLVGPNISGLTFGFFLNLRIIVINDIFSITIDQTLSNQNLLKSLIYVMSECQSAHKAVRFLNIIIGRDQHISFFKCLLYELFTVLLYFFNFWKQGI
jgi:hypothetical protein